MQVIDYITSDARRCSRNKSRSEPWAAKEAVTQWVTASFAPAVPIFLPFPKLNHWLKKIKRHVIAHGGGLCYFDCVVRASLWEENEVQT